jgi:serine/threonine protein kinase
MLQKWADRQSRDTTQFGAGTYPFMAPERYSGSWSIGPAADVFSVGMVGVWLLTGQLPSVSGSANPLHIRDLIVSRKYLERAKWLLSPRQSQMTVLLLKMIDPEPDLRPHDYRTLIRAFESA